MGKPIELTEDHQDQADEAVNGLIEEAEGLSGSLAESAAYLRYISNALLEHAENLESED
jgi:hypothetical protein